VTRVACRREGNRLGYPRDHIGRLDDSRPNININRRAFTDIFEVVFLGPSTRKIER
jgi:hypothetical protein